MTESCGSVCSVTIATYGTSISGVSTVCTIGSCYFCVVAVTVSGNYFLCYSYGTTYGALLTIGKTGCGTSRCGAGDCFLGVTESCSSVCGVTIATYGTSISGVTAYGTSGCCYYRIVAVTVCCNLICNVAVATCRTSISGVSTVYTVGIGYYRLIIVRAGVILNCKVVGRTVRTLNCRVILHLYIFSILGEVKHCYHALGAMVIFSIHNLRVDKNLSYLVAVNADLLGYKHVITLRVATHNHADIGMKAQEIIPQIICRIVVGIVSGSISAFGRFAESSVTLQILMSSYDYSMVGMRCNNLVCPNKNIVLGAVIQAKDHIINVANLKGMIYVINSSLFIVTCDVLSISGMIAEILIEELNTVVAVTADKRIRNLSIHHGDSFLSVGPLLVGSGRVVVGVSNVHTVFSYITKTDNILNVHCILVIKDPLIDGLEMLGILVINCLSITDNCKAVCVVVSNRLYILFFPKKLLISYIIAIVGKI